MMRGRCRVSYLLMFLVAVVVVLWGVGCVDGDEEEEEKKEKTFAFREGCCDLDFIGL